MRATLQQIKQHKYFRNTNWAELHKMQAKVPYLPPSLDSVLGPAANVITSEVGVTSPGISHKKSKVLGDYHLQKINKIFKDF